MSETNYLNLNAVTLEDMILASQFGIKCVIENGHITEIIEKIGE